MVNKDHHFNFDLDKGIRDQLVPRLEASPLLPLVPGVGPTESGVYALYLKRKLVYIGKASKETTKSGRTLRDRLNEHVTKLKSRDKLDISDIRCRFLTFESEWWVFASEFALITHYKPEWNGSGYGSKTPGRGRPGTARISKFDTLYPKRTTSKAAVAEPEIDDEE